MRFGICIEKDCYFRKWPIKRYYSNLRADAYRYAYRLLWLGVDIQINWGTPK
jgi:hypothetical protein